VHAHESVVETVHLAPSEEGALDHEAITGVAPSAL